MRIRFRPPRTPTNLTAHGITSSASTATCILRCGSLLAEPSLLLDLPEYLCTNQRSLAISSMPSHLARTTTACMCRHSFVYFLIFVISIADGRSSPFFLMSSYCMCMDQAWRSPLDYRGNDLFLLGFNCRVGAHGLSLWRCWAEGVV